MTDLTGHKFGRLLVLGIAEPEYKSKRGRTWKCLCDCGKIAYRPTGDLTKTKNPVRSCGCIHSEQLSQRNRESGIRGGDSKNPEFERLYHIWGVMRHRCNNQNDTNYHLYGGRGITVCEEWQNNWFAFKEWALSHGYQDDLTIDRINVNGNYEPDNCRWTTQQVQANNTRTNKILTYHGEDDTLANWCRRLNLDYFRTKARLNTCGYSVEDAFERGKYEYRTT